MRRLSSQAPMRVSIAAAHARRCVAASSLPPEIVAQAAATHTPNKRKPVSDDLANFEAYFSPVTTTPLIEAVSFSFVWYFYLSCTCEVKTPLYSSRPSSCPFLFITFLG
ncbi:Hypothetical protein, putative [Bodo saltans]|uniref:Uncharacterized protein n=1 Tax=Bodo saltans TaxID=75058 RepID=A0A0S4KK88_BODSA|nr:Hypothetical protein, putative [Bodo saltans]|eukprot:CUI15590.1 Hypothetical protein, putative [Bodo saltans]